MVKWTAMNDDFGEGSMCAVNQSHKYKYDNDANSSFFASCIYRINVIINVFKHYIHRTLLTHHDLAPSRFLTFIIYYYYYCYLDFGLAAVSKVNFQNESIPFERTLHANTRGR